jgi:hypothetical protein
MNTCFVVDNIQHGIGSREILGVWVARCAILFVHAFCKHFVFPADPSNSIQPPPGVKPFDVVPCGDHVGEVYLSNHGKKQNSTPMYRCFLGLHNARARYRAYQ